MDGRRRQWLPLSAEFPFDKTGTRLQEELGPAGPMVWVCLLTAAKRADIQGWFTYTTDMEAWGKLGIVEPERLGFTLDDFLTVTGHLKKTARRHRGRITDVRITAWEEWNNKPRTGSGRKEKTKSDPLFVRHPNEETAPDSPPLRAIDSDSDNDSDSNPTLREKDQRLQEYIKAEALRVAKTRGADNPEGYAASLVRSEDFVEKETRAFLQREEHRDCDACKGKGWDWVYPQAGGPRVKVECAG